MRVQCPNLVSPAGPEEGRDLSIISANSGITEPLNTDLDYINRK
jgi:hypothetical protein